MTKQTKILISVVLSCTLLLLLFIPSFATSSSVADTDTVLIEAGTYIWNDILTPVSFDSVIPFEFSTPTLSAEGLTLSNVGSISVAITDADIFVLTYNYGDSDGNLLASIQPYSSEYLWETGYLISDGSIPLAYGQVITLTEDVYLPYDVGVWVNSNLREYDVYDGNPFVDVMNMVIEALDVPLFGTFSIWDMLTTVCGLFAVVWLLKLLAGG